MHILQWIAVQTDGIDKEDKLHNALNSVKSFLDENIDNNWYDWFVVGGGRWNMSNEDDNVLSGYDENKTNMIISFEYDGVDAIRNRIDTCIEGRIREFNDYRLQVADLDINAKLDSYTGVMDYSFDLYPLGKMIDMLQGEWDFNSYFFDSENSSTNPKHMLDNIASGDVDWYLVPVDFHF